MEKTPYDIRRAERFLLEVNNVFGPPISVRNRLFEKANKLIGKGRVPRHVRYWLKCELRGLGYKECEMLTVQKPYYQVERCVNDGEYKILNNGV
jgi:hypothetical protein